MGLKFLHGLLEVKDCSVPLQVEPVIMMSLLLGEVTLELRLAPLQREWDAKPYYSHINWRQLGKCHVIHRLVELGKDTWYLEILFDDICTL